jgi:hypothetical protein
MVAEPPAPRTEEKTVYPIAESAILDSGFAVYLVRDSLRLALYPHGVRTNLAIQFQDGKIAFAFDT